jgi:glycosyltransferase involved in cell wall biosynthesis
VAESGADAAHFTDGLVPLRRSRPTVVSILDLSLVRQWRSHRVVRYARIPFVLVAPRLATRVIAISQATADEVIRLTGTAARRIDVIPLAPRASARPIADDAVAAVLAGLGLARGGFLLVPGTLEPRKNHVRVINAFEDLARRAAIPSDMQLVLAGQRGWRADRTLATLAASPVSTYEGFGLPVLEAMACGATVVTSTVSSLPEVAGDAGILVDPYDPSAIADGIVSALGAGAVSRRRSIERAARFTWAATAAATAAVYDRLR